MAVTGLHHVTVIAGDPRENLEFYTELLGMRLVKKSVNQDVPNTYHLFYADGAGSPGTDLTFFPWPDMEPGTPGSGRAVEVSLAVGRGSLKYWEKRIAARGIATDGPNDRFGERTLTFRDLHGVHLALVEVAEREFVPWAESPVPEEHQICGLHSARLLERSLKAPQAVLESAFGMEEIGVDGDWHRYAVGDGGSGRLLDVRELPGSRQGVWGPGSIHHIAWRVDDETQLELVRNKITELGLKPTRQIDRFWFKSVYFNEPGGMLFEIATDGPGFAIDEAPEALGEKLVLPPWLEKHRSGIESVLPQLKADGSEGSS